MVITQRIFKNVSFLVAKANKIKKHILLITLTLMLVLISIYFFARSFWLPVYTQMVGQRAIDEVINKIKAPIEASLVNDFEKAHLAYPPQSISFLIFKEEKQLELWAQKETNWIYIKTYTILAASGHNGPKLKEGDRQVPEGIYQIELLNPHSSYYLSMKINYPNEFDLLQAKIDGRENLGGDIYIHGNSVSIGCVAMGDEVIEELFILADIVGIKNVNVIITPADFRNKKKLENNLPWVNKLYVKIKDELNKYNKN